MLTYYEGQVLQVSYYNFTTDSKFCPIINTQFVQSYLNEILPVGF